MSMNEKGQRVACANWEIESVEEPVAAQLASTRLYIVVFSHWLQKRRFTPQIILKVGNKWRLLHVERQHFVRSL